MYLLGYDIGSHAIKVALLDATSNKKIAVVQYPDSEMDIVSRQSGWAEQEPEIWWHNVILATRRLLNETKIKTTDIQGIGISYQMHGLVLVDRDQNVLRPAIIWCDNRGVEIGKKAFEDLGQVECLNRHLNSPGNFTASKLKWVKDNEPNIYKRVFKFMLPGDFIAMRMTGQLFTTISGLSEAILWDYEKKEISKSVIDYYGIDEEMIPDLIPSFSFQGFITQHVAQLTGLKTTTPVSYRSGNQPTNALSLNVTQPNEIAATSGSSGVIYGVVDKPLYDVKSRVNSFAHINYEENYDRIGVLLCLNGAGNQYRWMKQQMGVSGVNYVDIESMITTVPIGSDGVCIIPFGNGSERTLDNINPMSHIFNIQFNRHNCAHLFRAALEGVAFSFVNGVKLLKNMGMNLDIIRVGNDDMFQSRTFSNIISTMLDCQIDLIDTTVAIGAARAAGVGTGAFNSLDDALNCIVPKLTYEPSLNKIACQQAYNIWESNLENTLSNDRANVGLARNQCEIIDDLKNRLNNNSKDMTSMHLQLMASHDFLLEMKEGLGEMSSNLSEKYKEKYAKLLRKIDGYIHSDKTWKDFEDHFELIYSDFFKNLKRRYPELTVSEIKLSALLKMKITTKDIARQLNLSVRGVETRLYRLKKKLDVNQNIKLEAFIDRI